jgi:hypothetical protein
MKEVGRGLLSEHALCPLRSSPCDQRVCLVTARRDIESVIVPNESNRDTIDMGTNHAHITCTKFSEFSFLCSTCDANGLPGPGHRDM